LEIGACIWNFRQLPVSRKKLLAARAEFRRIDALLGRLIRSFEAAHRQTSGALLLIALPDLEKLRKRVRAWIEGFDMLARSGAGQRDVAKEWLYWRVLGIWTDCFSGKLVTSTAPGRAPYGPLVRFFDAIVRPLLGDKAPGPYAIRSIVKQERRRREEAAGWLAAVKQKYGDGVVRVTLPTRK
jgi:hypothetical protein